MTVRTLILPLTMIVLSRLGMAQQSATPPVPVAAAAPVAESAATPPAAEDKHIFGVLPNYRTVEGSQPFSRLTSRQKLRIATKDTIDGPSYVMAGLFAGLYQLENQN